MEELRKKFQKKFSEDNFMDLAQSDKIMYSKLATN